MVGVVSAFAQGQDPAFDLGDSYELAGPGMSILYWPSPDRATHGFEKVIRGPVKEFALKDRWIIGRTVRSWFAIDKESHDVHESKARGEIEAVTHIDFDRVELQTDPTPYLIATPQALAARSAANTACWVLLFVIPAIFACLPVLVARMCEKQRLLKPGTNCICDHLRGTE
jgi:hypothetical protein